MLKSILNLNASYITYKVIYLCSTPNHVQNYLYNSLRFYTLTFFKGELCVSSSTWSEIKLNTILHFNNMDYGMNCIFGERSISKFCVVYFLLHFVYSLRLLIFDISKPVHLLVFPIKQLTFNKVL
jgi:hypothetical protein